MVRSCSMALACFVGFGIIQTVAQTLPKFNANLDEVTVYRVGASLSHTAKVNLPAGTTDIIINNVASNLDENSIQISAPAAMAIMSVSINRNTIGDDGTKSPDYMKRETALNEASKALQKTQIKIIAFEKSLTMLEQNQSIAGQNTGINVLELGKMTDYYLAKQTELRDKLFDQREIEKTQKEGVAQLNTQLGQLKGEKNGVNTGGQLRLQVMATAAVQGDLNITYLSNAATWNAAYDLKAEKINQPITLIYKANVYQNTGLDWNKVKLSLSTGNPSQGSNIPVLSTWFLRYLSPERDELYSKKREKAYSANAKYNTIQSASADIAIEDPITSEVSIGSYVTTQDNAVATTFNIDLPYSIASNNKAHAVALQDHKLNAAYKYYAVPRLDPDAMLLAEVTDFEKLNLVPGDANIIFENKYVGKTTLNPFDTQDTLNVSMGRDKRIVVKKVQVAEQTGVKLIGANKKQTFVYEISVKNSKAESIELLLKDQIPVSTDNNMEVELLNADDAAVNKEIGVLTWRLNLKPGENKKVRFSYSVKYPKDKVLSNL